MVKSNTNNLIKKEITFYYQDHLEFQTWLTVSNEAKKRGYSVIFSNDMDLKSEIGFYCSDFNKPDNSKFSLVMLHGMDQGRVRWPNIWVTWPWNKFDIALLPGREWRDRWCECSWDPYAHPRVGVYEVGSPKADLIFDKQYEFDKELQKIKNKLNLPFEKTVLYAPSFETDGKQNDVVNAILDLKVNLLIKHWVSEDDKNDHPDIWFNIKEANEKHIKMGSQIKVIDPKISIMYCLGFADLLITDESSVAYEALLFNIKTISVSSWPMRINNTVSPRVIRPAAISYSSTLELLSKNIEKFIYFKEEVDESKHRDRHFSSLGLSAMKIMELVDFSLNNLKPSNSIIATYKISRSIVLQRSIIYLMSRLLPIKLRKFLLKIIMKNNLMERYLGSRV
jgi:hypothetical protein